MGRFRSIHVLLPAMVGFGLKHRRVWAILPFLLLAVGVFGFARLSEHAEWSGGTTFLVGTLMLMLFVILVGPVAVLPAAVRTSVEREKKGKPVVDLMEALKKSVEESGLHRSARQVSMGEGTRTRYRRPG